MRENPNGGGGVRSGHVPMRLAFAALSVPPLGNLLLPTLPFDGDGLRTAEKLN